MTDSHGLVAAALKQDDPDRYYATLLLPPAARADVQALFAFNAEVAAVGGRAREPAAGEIRLQWWRDVLAGKGHGEVGQSPVAAALLDVIARHAIPVRVLERLLAARRFDLYQDPMPDLPSFEGYAGETTATLYQLSRLIVSGSVEGDSGDAAGHFGVAAALVGHLRAFGYNASRGRLFLPLSIFSANGVMETEIFTGTESEGLFAALAQIADIARSHLTLAADAIAGLAAAERRVFTALPLIEMQLDRAEKSPTPFSPPQEPSEWRKIAAMTMWSWRRA